jgi:hypothetical protein
MCSIPAFACASTHALVTAGCCVQLVGHLLYIVFNGLAVLWLTSRQQLYRLFTFSTPLHTLTVSATQQVVAWQVCLP